MSISTQAQPDGASFRVQALKVPLPTLGFICATHTTWKLRASMLLEPPVVTGGEENVWLALFLFILQMCGSEASSTVPEVLQ